MGVWYHVENGSPGDVVALRQGMREGVDSLRRRRLRGSLVPLVR